MTWTDHANLMLSTVATVALSGGAVALSAVSIDPAHFNLHELKHVGFVFLAGSVIALANWMRQQPRPLRTARLAQPPAAPSETPAS